MDKFLQSSVPRVPPTTYQESMSEEALTSLYASGFKHHYKVTIIGHSYVRRLRDYRSSTQRFPGVLTVDGKCFLLKYVCEGGKDYSFFNQSIKHKIDVVESSPDIVLVVLGGNAVGNMDISIPEATEEMRRYFYWLQDWFPAALLVASEVEPRYNLTLPAGQESYWRRRNAFNQALKRMPGKHYTHRISIYLNHREFYTGNGVHLNDRGNHFYWGLISETLSGLAKKFGL